MSAERAMWLRLAAAADLEAWLRFLGGLDLPPGPFLALVASVGIAEEGGTPAPPSGF